MTPGLLALTSATLVPASCILVGGAAVTALAAWRRWSPALWVSIAVAVGLRVAMAVVAHGHTPHDVEAYFHTVANVAHHGGDPLVATPRFEWNFLPAMPYLWAALLHLHLSWDVTVRIPVIVAEVLNTVLVAALAPARKRLRAFQYAANPLACLVAGWHGQIEPIALACGLFALVLLRRRADVTAAGLVGLGVAIKTWPALFGLAVVRGSSPRRWPLVGAALVAVPLSFFVTMPVFLHVHLHRDADIILGYRSYVGVWGWSGLVRLARGRSIVGYTGARQIREQHIAVVLFAGALGACLWFWRRAASEVFMLAVLLVFLVTTAGFGLQYLMWPLPLAIAYSTRRTWLYVGPASLYAAYVYLGHQSVDAQIWWSLPVIAGIVLALPIDQRVARTRSNARADFVGSRP